MILKRHLKLTVMAGAIGLAASSAWAQEAAEPAEGLPEVEVIQQKKAPAKAAKKKAAPVQAASPAPQPPPSDFDVVDTAPSGPGARGADGRVISNPSISPVDPSQGALPTDLQNYAGAGTRVTTGQIDEQRPRDNHELLSRVPGVIVSQDDGMARHSGIGIRGSPPRRSRKILVMEDGVPINFSTYLDASTHYTPPTHRIESVEVLRGTIVAYGPLNNHGVINFRNLNVFGPNETVISAAIGHTEDVKKDVNNYRHVHTRQNLGNAGVVASYSGGDAGGAWDNEVLRYNDFYGALGLRGSMQDLTVSGGYFRQRDNYDETKFRGDEADFYAFGRQKSNRPGATGFNQANRVHTNNGQTDFNTYNADLYRVQLAHNFYIDDDTTLTTRLYYSHNERKRFESRNGGPAGPNANSRQRGRERAYEFYGVDSRIEFANQPLFSGLTYDLQAGIRYEEHAFRNCNSGGPRGVQLSFDADGNCFATTAIPGFQNDGQLTKFDSDSFAAFVQAAIHVTRDLTITPGLRFENYDVTREQVFTVPLVNRIVTSDHDHVLAAIGFAWEAMPRSTVYGGFHQGIAPHIARGPAANAYPIPDEKGDNYQIGFRTTAVRGLTLDLAYFHNKIENYQVKGAVSDPLFGNSVYGAVDEVEINGFEIYSRLDSKPFTGGPWNFFGEAVYTYADNEIKEGIDFIPGAAPLRVDVAGNKVPEVPESVASLTLGVDHASGWDFSVTATYRGEYFVDARNTSAWTCVNSNGLPLACNDADAEGVLGKVDSQWLLAARANYTVPNTALTLFVSGQNLTDEFYVADLADGAVPGIGRTLWAGFTYKFD